MITKIFKALAVASVLAGATTAMASTHTHTGYQQMLSDYHLNSVVLGARGQGFNLLVANHRDQIDAGAGTVSFVVLLQAGQDYRLAALCEAGCNGLRISLQDNTGREVAADDNDSGSPRLNFFAPHTGAYVVTLALTNCSGRCNVGAVVLGRSAPPAEAGQLPHRA